MRTRGYHIVYDAPTRKGYNTWKWGISSRNFAKERIQVGIRSCAKQFANCRQEGGVRTFASRFTATLWERRRCAMYAFGLGRKPVGTANL